MALFLFNWAGYRVYFSYVEKQVNARMEADFNNDNYDEQDLITIKLPVSQLPYYTNSPIFERVDGEVAIGDMHYKYVKRRIYNDSLEVLALPNPVAKHITNARDEFFKMVNDLQQASSSGKAKAPKANLQFKNLLSDYYVDNEIKLPSPKVRLLPTAYPSMDVELKDIRLLTPEQPPDQA